RPRNTREASLPSGIARFPRETPFAPSANSLGTPQISLQKSAKEQFRESLQVVTSPCCPRQLPDVISESLSLDAGSPTPAVHRVLSPVSSTASSAFPRKSWVGFPRLSCDLRLLAA